METSQVGIQGRHWEMETLEAFTKCDHVPNCLNAGMHRDLIIKVIPEYIWLDGEAFSF